MSYFIYNKRGKCGFCLSINRFVQPKIEANAAYKILLLLKLTSEQSACSYG